MTTTALARSTKAGPPTRPPLTPHQRAMLRALTHCAEETIVAWWSGEGKDGRRVREATALRLEDGARKIGLLPGGEGR